MKIQIRDLGGDYVKNTEINKSNFLNMLRSYFKPKFKETNALTKDKKFVIPLKEYRLLYFIYFSHKYSKWNKNWKLSFNSGVKKYPVIEKFELTDEDMKDVYGDRWQNSVLLKKTI